MANRVGNRKRKGGPLENNVGNGQRKKRSKFTLSNPKAPENDRETFVLVTGAGDVGQLGLGPDVTEKTRPALLNFTDHKIVDTCAGGMHTVCLTTTGKVLTFGCNDEGALGRVTDGIEDAEFRPGEVELPGSVIQISAGDSHTVALLEDGRTFAWGTFRDSHGNMGLTLRGNEKQPYEMMIGSRVVKVASGVDHIVFLTNNGDVYTCGCPEQGQLGRVTKRSSNRDARNGIGKDQLDKLLTPAPISMKPSLKLKFDNIWAGRHATFVKVSARNDIYVFGLNNYNQLGVRNVETVFAPTLSREFSRYSWKMICNEQHHSVALSEDQRVYVIGRKEYGRLGLGADIRDDATELTEIVELRDKRIVAVGSGTSSSFAVTARGDLYAWGMGTNGQLGNGTEADYFVPTLITGTQLADKHVIKVTGGGQHTVILAYLKNNTEGH